MSQVKTLQSLPQLNYTLPEWEMLLEFDEQIRNRILRFGSPYPSDGVIAVRQGAIDMLLTYGQERLYETMSQMKFAWNLYMS